MEDFINELVPGAQPSEPDPDHAKYMGGMRPGESEEGQTHREIREFISISKYQLRKILTNLASGNINIEEALKQICATSGRSSDPGQYQEPEPWTWTEDKNIRKIANLLSEDLDIMHDSDDFDESDDGGYLKVSKDELNKLISDIESGELDVEEALEELLQLVTAHGSFTFEPLNDDLAEREDESCTSGGCMEPEDIRESVIKKIANLLTEDPDLLLEGMDIRRIIDALRRAGWTHIDVKKAPENEDTEYLRIDINAAGMNEFGKPEQLGEMAQDTTDFELDEVLANIGKDEGREIPPDEMEQLEETESDSSLFIMAAKEVPDPNNPGQNKWIGIAVNSLDNPEYQFEMPRYKDNPYVTPPLSAEELEAMYSGGDSGAAEVEPGQAPDDDDTPSAEDLAAIFNL